MSDIRVQTWPLAVVGSLLLHGTLLTGLYVVPGTGPETASRRADIGASGAAHLPLDAAPLYILPDELPPDVADKLARDAALAQPPEKPPADLPPSPPKKEEVKVAAAPPPPETTPVKLGDPDSTKTDVKSWIKSDDKGEHVALPSVVDQPSLDRKATPDPIGDPGQGGNDGKNGEKAPPVPAEPLKLPDPPAPPPPPAPPAPEAPPTQPAEQVGPPAPAMPEVKAEAAVAASTQPETQKSPLPEGPAQPAIDAGNSGGETPTKTQPATAPAAAPAPTPAKPGVEGSPGSPATTPATTAQPAASSEAPGQPGQPGAPVTARAKPSDRDADAASVRRAAVFRNGRVDAGEGLDIKTVRPEFPLTTKALIVPRSPTLEIVFGKDGRARRVRVLKSSGYPEDVDGPVVTALYNWRARGRLLNELTRPDATLALEITIILQ